MPELRPEQVVAVDKAYGMPGFLNGDDVGSGKTVMALFEAREYFRVEGGPMFLLVVTLKTPIKVWVDHMPVWIPEAQVLTPKSKLEPDELKLLKSKDPSTFVVVVVNWAQLRINMDLRKVKWAYIAADESQNANNRKAQQTKGLKKQKAEFKRAFTATEIINSPADIWSILHWLYPKGPEWLGSEERGLFTSYWRFFEEFVEYTVHPKLKFKMVDGPKNEEALREMIEPFYIARPQSVMNPEIEKPLFIPVKVDLLPKQRRAYNEMKEESMAWIGEHENEPLWAKVAISKLTRLRQLCTAYAHFDHIPHEDGFDEMLVTLSEPSTKLDAVMDKLEEIGNHQVVICSNFAQTIDLAVKRFVKSKISYSRLTGDITSDKVRGEEIDKFVRGDTRVYISTIDAGGVGVDGLQHATNIGIRIDRHWSPAKNKQWIGRIKRSGQKFKPIIYDIEAEDTVDQEVEEKLKMKASWILRMLGKEL